jgi:uncharacterized protein with PIN domain
MKEIIYKNVENNQGKQLNDKCPCCGNPLRNSKIPCPEQKEGCIVIHYGYRCDFCGKIYQ